MKKAYFPANFGGVFGVSWSLFEGKLTGRRAPGRGGFARV
jgi:hypothetical protein